MKLPAFYRPDALQTLSTPNWQAASQIGDTASLRPAATDSRRILALFIDMQVDFVFPAPIGQLSVPNAVADTRRTIDWLYRNMGQVTHIVASLDTHTPLQIFFSGWWQDKAGKFPDPYTVITSQAVKQGEWIPVLLPDWSRHYLDELEHIGKKKLMIWPYHCLEGSIGRTLVPALNDAIMVHSAARVAAPTYLIKGTLPQTEFYSAIEPEVKVPELPAGGLNRDFLEMLTGFDLIYVAGQARSHCVLETMNSILDYFQDEPQVIQKLRFMNDCTSPIRGFEAETERQVGAWAASGVRLISAGDPIG